MEIFQDILVDFVVRHKLSDNALKELLKLFQNFLPKPNNVPNHFGHRRKSVTSDGFEVLDVRKQLSLVVERNLDYLAEEETLNIFLNTDGASPFRSSKICFWPFWALIDNLPSPRRAALDNMILVALWKGNLS